MTRRNYISEGLEQEIRDKYLYLMVKNASERILRVDKLERRAIEKMSQIHSYKMEHPHSKTPYCIPKNNGGKIKEGIIKLRKAFKWGCENFDPEEFDESFIREIAGRIVPERFSGGIAKYRELDQGTGFSGDYSVTPPYPRKLVEKEIPNFEEGLNEKLKSPYETDMLEAAIYSHFHIARMHPFVDGNGRTARITQDVILHHFGFPAPIIEAGERDTYYDFLDGAVKGWKEENNWDRENVVTDGEKAFYTFMAGKVNSSLDKVICAIRRG